MTTWTDIAGAAVAVGGIPSSATVTALRDNPSALAETASGAPVMQSGWHPVDKVTVGDGKDGLIYSGATSGSVSAIVTPNFVDGYEYRIIASDIGQTSGTATVDYSIYGETTGWVLVRRLVNSLAIAEFISIEITLSLPRISQRMHLSVTNQAGTLNGNQYTFSTAQKLRNARILFSGANATTGKVWLLRRRDYASLP